MDAANNGCRQLSLLASSLMPDAKDFYEHLVNKIIIKFIPRLPTQAENRIFELTLNKKMSYDQVLWLPAHVFYCESIALMKFYLIACR